MNKPDLLTRVKNKQIYVKLLNPVETEAIDSITTLTYVNTYINLL